MKLIKKVVNGNKHFRFNEKSKRKHEQSGFDKMGRSFNANTEEELEMILDSSDPAIKRAAEIVEYVNKNKDLRVQAEQRDNAIRAYRSDMSFSFNVKGELLEINKNVSEAQRFGFLYFSHQVEKEGTIFKISDINKANLADVLRGVFLACGNISYPNKNFHLEFCLKSLDDALNLITLIESVADFKFSPKALRRRKNPVVYLKGSEKIISFLTFLGAKKSAEKLNKTKIIKEVRNYINRTTNFQAANISKTANSAAVQLGAIKKLKESGNFDRLSENLKEIANLRFKYPELSLLKIGEKCSPKISRSGANHRFEKILKISIEPKN